MFIQTESTPNPATLKFLPGQPVLPTGTADFPAADAAGGLAAGHAHLRRGRRRRACSSAPTSSPSPRPTRPTGRTSSPAILGAIMEHFQSGQPVIEGAAGAVAHASHDGPDAEIVSQIKELLDTRVRPAVAQDGGDITFHGFDRGVVYLHMQGACAGCPSSTMTLKMGIENLLRHYIPEVTEVRPVGRLSRR